MLNQIIPVFSTDLHHPLTRPEAPKTCNIRQHVPATRPTRARCTHYVPVFDKHLYIAVLAHLSGSGRSRAVWTSPWQALHAPRLVTGIGVDLRSRLYLARSHSDLHHMRSREIQPRSQVDPDACNETRSVQRLPRRCPYCPGSSRTDRVSEYGTSDGVEVFEHFERRRRFKPVGPQPRDTLRRLWSLRVAI